MAAEVPKTRFIWDELLSHRVAKALRVLGYRVTYVGNDGDNCPPRGSFDATIIDFALRTNQVIVTSNHDMIALCNESNQPFVWIDPRGGQLRLEEQVVLAFSQIQRWDQILTAGVCVRALRSGARPITSAEASRLALQRHRALQSLKRQSPRQGTPVVSQGEMTAVSQHGRA